MVNLLPQYWQKKIKDEEIFKTVLILGLDVVFAILSFILMIFLMKLFYSGKIASLEMVALEKEQQMEIFNTMPVEKDILRVKKSISAVDDFYRRQIKVSELFSRVAAANPGGIEITGFNYSPAAINIKGFAFDRDKLVSFKENLEAVSEFKEVNFPQNSWLRAQDIDFAAEIKLLESVKK